MLTTNVSLRFCDATEVVEDFVKWVYTGETMEMKPETFLDYDGAAVVYRRIVALYGLAEKVCCVALKKVLVDRLFALLVEINKANMPSNFPLTEAVREAYAVTTTGSALRKLIVATDCYLVEIDWFLKEDGAEETLNLGDEHATAVFRGFAAKSAFRDDGNPFTQESAEHFYDEDMKNLAKAMPEDVYTGLDPKWK